MVKPLLVGPWGLRYLLAIVSLVLFNYGLSLEATVLGVFVLLSILWSIIGPLIHSYLGDDSPFE